MREAINQLDPTMSIPYEGEDDSRWKWNQKQQLMAERDRLQQLLQRPEEITDEEIQEIQMQIREITKELDMDMRMAGGGLASLRGGGRTMNPRAAGAAALRRRFPQPMQRLMPGQPGVSADDPRLQWQVGGPGGG
jgi:TolA-binding protein